ncbi:MAG: amino acid adenylation domain-containing protein, partial [Geobacteraceae bacterium]|nr:amino acid adenylation domain-containing protein [Geobacteraceae bacterium]
MHYHQKIHDCFKLLAIRQPSAPAIITDEICLTYADLDAASDKLAIELQTRGIEIEESIGVLTDRSADLPAAFLAILKAGGVYVPMAADLPADRLANMAEQAGIRRLIVLDGIKIPPSLSKSVLSNGCGKLSDAVIRPEELPASSNGAEVVDKRNSRLTTLAAILFTSGSSGMCQGNAFRSAGTPKGVPLTHASCINMVLGHIDAQGITSKDRILLSSSPVFILGFRTLCIPLISGSAFVPVTLSTIYNPLHLLELMSRHQVSIALFTPSYLHLLNGAVPKGLRCIMTAGELPNVEDARHYARHVDYWNIYGATEVCGTIC